MQYYQDRAWLEISLDVIAENYHMIKKEIGDKSEIMAVIKADAYGWGLCPSPICWRNVAARSLQLLP